MDMYSKLIGVFNLQAHLYQGVAKINKLFNK